MQQKVMLTAVLELVVVQLELSSTTIINCKQKNIIIRNTFMSKSSSYKSEVGNLMDKK